MWKVRGILTQVANYVRTTANGDADILSSSGFEMAKVPERVGLPGAPQRLVVLVGELPGTTEVRWRRERGANTYKVMRSDKDPSVEANWEVVSLTSTVTSLSTPAGSSRMQPRFLMTGFGYNRISSTARCDALRSSPMLILPGVCAAGE